MPIKKFIQFCLTQSAFNALQEKAEAHSVSVEVLQEVFDRGIVAWSDDTQKTPEQYAFNRVDSFLSGGYAAKLDEDLLNELSTNTLTSYAIKAAKNKTEAYREWRGHKDEHANQSRLAKSMKNIGDDRGAELADKFAASHAEQASKQAAIRSKRTKGLDRATDRIAAKAMPINAHEETQLDELSTNTLTNYAIKAGADEHKQHKRLQARSEHGVDATKAYTKMKNRQFGIKKATNKIVSDPKVAVGVHEENDLQELSAGLLRRYVTKGVDSSGKLDVASDSTNDPIKAAKLALKSDKRKKWVNKAAAKLGPRPVKEDESKLSNAIDISGTELIERNEIDPVQKITVKRHETKSSKVVRRHTQREKPMYDTNRTGDTVRHSFKMGTGVNKGHMVDRKGNSLTNRWHDERKNRFASLRDRTKSYSMAEGVEYIEAKQKLHDAHAETGRQLAGMERNPEIRQVHLHRAKKHEHARRVLDILKSTQGKKK